MLGGRGTFTGGFSYINVSSVELVNTELRYTSTAVYVYSSGHYFVSCPAVYQSFEMRSRLGDELIRAHSDGRSRNQVCF